MVTVRVVDVLIELVPHSCFLHKYDSIMVKAVSELLTDYTEVSSRSFTTVPCDQLVLFLLLLGSGNGSLCDFRSGFGSVS